MLLLNTGAAVSPSLWRLAAIVATVVVAVSPAAVAEAAGTESAWPPVASAGSISLPLPASADTEGAIGRGGGLAQFGGDGGNSTVPEPLLEQVTNPRALSSQLAISLALGLLVFLVFCLLRYRWPHIYSPRTYSRMTRRVRLSKALFGWTIEVWNTPDSKILGMYGVDSLVFLRMLRLMCKLFLFMALTGILVITPLKVFLNSSSGGDSGSKQQDDNNTHSIWGYLTITALWSDHPLWVQLLFAYLYSGAVYVIFGRFMYEVLGLRWNCWPKIRQDLSARSVMLTGISSDMASKDDVADYFEKYIGGVESVEIVPDVDALARLIHLRARLLETLEARISWLVGDPCPAPQYDPVRIKAEIMSCEGSLRAVLAPYALPRAFWCKWQARRWYSKTDALWGEYLEIDRNLRLKRHHAANNHPTSIGFVTFKSAVGAQQAAQLVMSAAPFNMQTALAPEPCNVYWPNVTLPVGYRAFRSFVSLCVVMLVYAFWFTPMFIIARKLMPQSLGERFPSLHELFENPFIAGALIYTAPMLVLATFNVVIPYIMMAISEYSGYINSSIQGGAIKYNFFYLVISVILVFSLNEAIPLKSEWIEDPRKFTKKLADQLPNATGFIMNYVAFAGVGIAPIRLLRPDYFANRLLSHSPRSRKELHRPVQLNWSFLYPQPLLVFTVCMTYSTLAPFSSVLAFAYFGINYLVNKYLIMFVYERPFDTVGSLCLRSLHHLPLGMLVYHLLMVGLFSLKKSWCLPFMFPLIALNVWLIGQWAYTHESRIDFVPLELLLEGDLEHGRRRRLGLSVPASPFTTTSANHGNVSATTSRNNLAPESMFYRRVDSHNRDYEWGDVEAREDSAPLESPYYSFHRQASLPADDASDHGSERRQLLSIDEGFDESEIVFTPHPWYYRVMSLPGELTQLIWDYTLRYLWRLVYVDPKSIPVELSRTSSTPPSNSGRSSEDNSDVEDPASPSLPFHCHEATSISGDLGQAMSPPWRAEGAARLPTNSAANAEGLSLPEQAAGGVHSTSGRNADNGNGNNNHRSSSQRSSASEISLGREGSMNYVYGVLDSSIQDYRHPYIYGQLPELWLPQPYFV